MTSFNLILRSVSFARSFPPKVSSGARARGALGTETLHKIQCRKFRASIRFQSTPVTSFERVIAAFLPLRCQLAGRFERSGPVFGARLPAIFSRIRRDIRPGLLNFCRRFGSGKPSFLPLVQHPQKSGRSITQTFRFPPIGALLSPAVHGQTMQQKDARDHGKSYPQHG